MTSLLPGALALWLVWQSPVLGLLSELEHQEIAREWWAGVNPGSRTTVCELEHQLESVGLE